MADFDNTKYDIAIHPQASPRVSYRLRNYLKSESSPFIPRLGAGDQSESEFDILKSQTFESFEGGQFSRFFKDDKSTYAIEGLFPSYGDGVLWQVNHAAQVTPFGGGRPIVAAQCRSKDYVFVAVYQTTGGAGQRIYRIDSAGTIVSLTLPAKLSNNVQTIQTMNICTGYLNVHASNGTSSANMYYMPLSSTTVVLIPGGNAFYRSAIWNGFEYGLNGGIDAPGFILYKFTGNTTTDSVQEVGRVPTAVADYDSELITFNGRLLICRFDGIWAYDGIRISAVVDLTDQPHVQNCRMPVVMKGYLHFFMPDGFYRYNGSSLEKLYDITDIGYPVDAVLAKDRIFMAFRNSSASGSSRYDKQMGYNYSSGTNFDGRVVAYDGKGMFTYARVTSATKSGSPLLNNEGELHRLVWNHNENSMYFSTMADPSNNQWKVSLNEQSVTPAGSGAGSWQVVSPVMDNNFPMIFKSFANIELVLDGSPSADDSLLVEYRTAGFDGSTGWSTLGNIKLQTKLKLNVFTEFPGGISFKQVQFRVSPVTICNAAAGIAKIVFRHLLMPEYKYQWQLTLACYGDDPLEPLLLADLTQDTQSVSTLRGNAYLSRSQTQPVIFIDVDQFILTAAINSSVTTLSLDDAQLLKPSGYITINDEIIYYASKSGNTLNGLQRGVLGTAAASHLINAKTFIVNLCIVSQIQSDRVAVDDRGTDTPSAKARKSDVTLILREV